MSALRDILTNLDADPEEAFLAGVRHAVNAVRAVANEPNKLFAVIHDLDCEVTKLEGEL